MMLGVLAMAMLAATATQSQAEQIWDFSFTNAGPPTGGNTNGTVTGTIDLPLGVTGNTPDNGSVAATSVIITSYPAAVGNIGTTPIDTTTWSNQAGSLFTVVSGSLTVADFSAGYNSPLDVALSFDVSDGSLQNFPYTQVYGPISFTFEPPGSPTPEPASLTLLGTGLLAFGGFGRYRRRRASGPSTAC
jgi:hypothetical protein